MQTIFRVLASGSVELDEAEQLILTQHLDWGYGPQAPLFTWLQIGFFKLFGTSVFALALLKNLLLASTYAFTYLSARLVTRNPLAAAAASASLLFIQQISWESQRDLTHTVLAVSLSAATLYLFLQLTTEKRTWLYLALGLCMALGTLAKYNYVVLLIGLVLAALSLKQQRAVILDPRMLLAIGAGFGLLVPHARWMYEHQDLVFSSAGKLQVQTQVSWLKAVAAGLGDLGWTMLMVLGPLLLIYLLVCWKPLPPSTVARPGGDREKLIQRTLLIMLVELVLAVLIARATNFKDRWLLPIFTILPVLLVSALEARLNPTRLKRILLLGGGVAALVLVLMPGHLLLAKLRGKPFRLNAPFPQLAAQVRALNAGADVIVAENRWIGGNLRLGLPDTTVLVPELPGGDVILSRRCLIIWDATKRDSPPPALVKFAGSITEVESASGEPRYLEAPYTFFAAKKMRLGLLVVGL